MIVIEVTSLRTTSSHFLAAITLLGLQGTTASAEPSALQFKDVTSALQESATLKKARGTEEISGIARGIAKYDLFPRLQTSLSANKQWPSSATSKDREKSLSATLSTPVYDFGRYNAKADQLDAEWEVQKLTTKQTQDNLLVQAARLFLSILTQQGSLDIYDAQTTVMEEKLERQRQNYAQGLRPEADVLSVEADLGKTRLSAEKARAQLTQAIYKLYSMMGKPAPSTAVRARSKASDFFATDLPSFSAPAGTPNLSVKIKEETLHARQAERQTIKASRRPLLTLQLNRDYEGPLQEDDWHPNTTGSLALTWEIPWHGKDREELKRVTLLENQLRDDIAQEKINITSQQRIIKEQIELLKRQDKILRTQVDTANRQQKIIKARYEAGKATALELGNADADLLNVKLEQVRLRDSMLATLIDYYEIQSPKKIEELL